MICFIKWRRFSFVPQMRMFRNKTQRLAVQTGLLYKIFLSFIFLQNVSFWWNLIMVRWIHFYTVDSRYLKVQGTLWNTEISIPLHIRFADWGKYKYITKTDLYRFYPLKPHLYIVKLEFTGVYIIFLFLLKSIDCGYSLEPPRRGGSNEYPQFIFWAKIRKILAFFICKFSIFRVFFYIYLNRHVLVM